MPSSADNGDLPTYVFAVRLDRPPTDEQALALHHACVDAQVERGERHANVRFARKADSLPAAVASALDDVARVPKLRGLWVETDPPELSLSHDAAPVDQQPLW